MLRRRIDKQTADFLDTGLSCINASHQHVDLLVTPCVARREFTAYIGNDCVSNVSDGKPQFGSPLLVEHDLNFRVASFYSGFDIREPV